MSKNLDTDSSIGNEALGSNIFINLGNLNLRFDELLSEGIQTDKTSDEEKLDDEFNEENNQSLEGLINVNLELEEDDRESSSEEDLNNKGDNFMTNSKSRSKNNSSNKGSLQTNELMIQNSNKTKTNKETIKYNAGFKFQEREEKPKSNRFDFKRGKNEQIKDKKKYELKKRQPNKTEIPKVKEQEQGVLSQSKKGIEPETVSENENEYDSDYENIIESGSESEIEIDQNLMGIIERKKDGNGNGNENENEIDSDYENIIESESESETDQNIKEEMEKNYSENLPNDQQSEDKLIMSNVTTDDEQEINQTEISDNEITKTTNQKNNSNTKHFFNIPFNFKYIIYFLLLLLICFLILFIITTIEKKSFEQI
ncbi:hypothetical protein M0812_12389 [Anaeramoeba flamelloides]|uniref:Uncharacterized protein n=1 Tax=Anaeramoeba flamelloides TaxID=1746091 RepID=A0AAV7ZKX2_9EUKA|nr:hypothetical protein M0812_12389 [Anaeramoeba flamelloides]